MNKTYSFFANEMRKNPELYVDSSNCINLTKLAEAYLLNHPDWQNNKIYFVNEIVAFVEEWKKTYIKSDEFEKDTKEYFNNLKIDGIKLSERLYGGEPGFPNQSEACHRDIMRRFNDNIKIK